MAITRVYVSWATGSPVVGPSAQPWLDTLIVLPDGYDPGNLYPMHFDCHGKGATINAHSYDSTDATYRTQVLYDIANWFAANGYVFVAAHQGADAQWGNDASLAHVSNSYDYVLANYSVYPNTIGGGSMGGLPSLQLFHTYPVRFRGAILMNPVSDLDANHTPTSGNANYNASINTAYGCNNGTYEAATAGHNPIDFAASLALPIVIWHGTADVTVSINQSTAFAALAAAATVNSVAGATHSSLAVGAAYLAGVGAFLDSLAAPVQGQSGSDSDAIGDVGAIPTYFDLAPIFPGADASGVSGSDSTVTGEAIDVGTASSTPGSDSSATAIADEVATAGGTVESESSIAAHAEGVTAAYYDLADAFVVADAAGGAGSGSQAVADVAEVAPVEGFTGSDAAVIVEAEGIVSAAYFDLAPDFHPPDIETAEGTTGSDSAASGQASQVEQASGESGSSSGASGAVDRIVPAAGVAGSDSDASGDLTEVGPAVGASGAQSAAEAEAVDVETASGESASGSGATGEIARIIVGPPYTLELGDSDAARLEVAGSADYTLTLESPDPPELRVEVT